MLLLLKIIIYPLSLLPLAVIRFLLLPVKLFLEHILKYREKVILKNLKIAFPNEEIKFYKQIQKGFYKNLHQLISESIKSFTISLKNADKRIPVLNPEVMNQYADNQQDAIMVFGHFNNWEWTMFTGIDKLRHQRVALYQPLKNKAINNWIKENRARIGAILVSTKEVKEFYNQNKKLVSVAFIADQSPSRNGNGIWVNFFGRKTLFVSGFAATAIKRNNPILFIDIQRKSKGFYEIKIEDLVPNPTLLSIEEIVQKFAVRLEKQIKENPESWLWSHNRWKHEFKP